MNFTDIASDHGYSWFFANLDTRDVTEIKCEGNINDAIALYSTLCEARDTASHTANVFWTHQTYGYANEPDHGPRFSTVKVERVEPTKVSYSVTQVA